MGSRQLGGGDLDGLMYFVAQPTKHVNAKQIWTHVAALDRKSGKVALYRPGPSTYPGEPLYVADATGKGWLLCTFYDGVKDESTLHVLDAADIARGPTCVLRLASRVPPGFHGAWKAA